MRQYFLPAVVTLSLSVMNVPAALADAETEAPGDVSAAGIHRTETSLSAISPKDNQETGSAQTGSSAASATSQSDTGYAEEKDEKKVNSAPAESARADLKETASIDSVKASGSGGTGEDMADGDERADYKATVVARRPPPPGTHTSISREEMDLRGASSLPEALLLEPSVDVQEGAKSGSVLQIRGFDERAVLVLFEGIPIRESYDGHFNISSLPTFMLEGIDVQRGMTSLLYGTNSGGGIVTLRVPDKCRNGADVRLFAGNPRKGEFTRYGAAGNVCAAAGPFSLHLASSIDHSDGYILSRDYKATEKNTAYHEDGGIRDGSEFDRFSASALAQYAPERNKKISIFFNYIHSPRGVPTFEGSGFTRYWKFRHYDTVLGAVSGVYGPRIPPRSWGFRDARIRLYIHKHLDELNDYQDATYSSLTTNTLAWFVASSYDNSTYGASAQASFALNEGNRLEFSARYQFDENVQREIPVGKAYAAESWSRPDEFSSHSFGGAIEDSQVIGNWRFLLGIGATGMMLRSQIYGGQEFAAEDRTIPAVEGRFVAERSLGEHVLLTAGVGRKSRLPMLKELYSNNVGGNAELKAEHAWMAELGADVNVPEAGITGSVRGFFNAIENLIEKYYTSYDNVGKARTAGIEVEIAYSPLPPIKIISAYRYLYSRDVEHKRELDYRTPHKFRLTARWMSSFGLTADVTGLYSATQHAYYADMDTLVRDTVDGYFLLNASLRYDLGLGGKSASIYLFANGRNLLDANYSVGSYEPRPGRELMFGIGGRI